MLAASPQVREPGFKTPEYEQMYISFKAIALAVEAIKRIWPWQAIFVNFSLHIFPIYYRAGNLNNNGPEMLNSA